MSAGSPQILVADMGDHVSIKVVESIWRTCHESLRWSYLPCRKSAMSEWLDKLVRRAGFGHVTRLNGSSEPAFLVLMSPFRVPYFSTTLARSCGVKVALVYDAWPNNYDFLSQIIRGYNLSHVFVTSRDARDRLKSAITDVKIEWWPETITDERALLNDSPEKSIDIIQVGRRYERYHDAIKQRGLENGLNYIFEERKGHIIFPTMEAYFDGLRRSKISICFPRSVTHPEIAGDVSTVTQRYLESMVSRCLIVGNMPEEMREMFPYEPMIEADLERPFEQLVEILDALPSYAELLERNRDHVLNHHLLKHRLPMLEAAFHSRRASGGVFP